MEWHHYVCYFLGGTFFGNAVPHLVSGVMGRSFPSPFAKPPGRGLSSATVNVLWGFINLAAGYGLVFHVGDFALRSLPDALSLGLGILVISLVSAKLFGRVYGGNAPEKP